MTTSRQLPTLQPSSCAITGLFQSFTSIRSWLMLNCADVVASWQRPPSNGNDDLVLRRDRSETRLQSPPVMVAGYSRSTALTAFMEGNIIWPKEWSLLGMASPEPRRTFSLCSLTGNISFVSSISLLIYTACPDWFANNHAKVWLCYPSLFQCGS